MLSNILITIILRVNCEPKAKKILAKQYILMNLKNKIEIKKKITNFLEIIKKITKKNKFSLVFWLSNL